MLYWFNRGFNNGDFFVGEVVFGVKLCVDFLDAFAPVDVAIGGEVLHWYKLVHLSESMLCILLNRD